jgi:hypothetical protein
MRINRGVVKFGWRCDREKKEVLPRMEGARRRITAMWWRSLP